MNSLIHLEKELLSLSNQLKSISQELENHRNLSAGDREERYDHIKMLARKYPIKNTALRSADEPVKKAYFGLLMLIANAAQQEYSGERRLFLQRIAAGAGFSLDFEEWVRARAVIEEELAKGNRIHLEDHRYPLLLDGLLLINLTGTAAAEELRMLAELSIVLNVGQQELEMLAGLAKCLIHQSEEEFSSVKATDPLKWRGMFTHHIPAAWLKNSRVYCGSYEEISSDTAFFKDNQFKILSQLQENSIVKKDDVIMKYIKNGKEARIVAAKAGSVSYQKKETMKYYQRKVSIKVYIHNCFDKPDTTKT